MGSSTPTRQSSGIAQTEPTSLPTSTPSRASQGPSQKPHGHRSSGAPKSTASPNGANSPSANPQSASQRTPRIQTPKKSEVNPEKLKSLLLDFSLEIGVNHAKLTARLIHDAWEKDAPQQLLVSKKDWFAGLKLEPVGPGNKSSEAMRIKTKVSTILPRTPRHQCLTCDFSRLAKEGRANKKKENAIQ